MNADELKKRTERFALDVIAFVSALPNNETCRIIGRQLTRSGTGLGANYRSACRAKSQADFVNKIGTCEEESDECEYWLELLIESGQAPPDRVLKMIDEARQLTAIMSSSRMTA